MSRSFTSSSRPSTGPTHPGQDAARGARAAAGPARRGRGPRAGAARTRRASSVLGSFGATSATHTSRSGEDRQHDGDAAADACRPCRRPWRRPRVRAGLERLGLGARAGGATATRRRGRTTRRAVASAAARTTWVSGSGSTSAAATVSVMPCVAATTLRQSRRGSGARIHGEQPPGREERVAGGADRQHPRADRGRDVHAEGEDQERVDLAVEARAEPRRRPGAAGDPSVDEVERERDDASATSVATGASRTNESAVSAATPTASVARASVTQPAGPSRSERSRKSPRASAASTITPHASADDPARRRRGRPSPRAPRAAAPGRSARSTGPVWTGRSVPPTRRSTRRNGTVEAVNPVCDGRETGRARAVRPGPAAGPRGGLRAGRVRRAGELHARRRDPRAGACGPASGPGVSVLDLCCGVAGPGRFITRELGCRYLGRRLQRERHRHRARARARDLPCRFEVARVPPLPAGTFDVVLLLETLLAFPDKEPLLEGSPVRSAPAGGSPSRWRRARR